MVHNSRELSISNTVTVDDDAIGELGIDIVVLAKSSGHAHLQVVCELLSCGLEHHLAEVSVMGERERGGGDKRKGRESGRRGRGRGEDRGGRGREAERREKRTTVSFNFL